jgi:SAM-dependent methyltransferase
VTSLDDPALVRAEYASERGLEGRKAAYRFADGPDARRITIDAVLEARPRRILDVGCGTGDLAERIARESGADVVAVDLSPRMVELTAARGIDARVGDAQELPYADGAFDCALAAWMLYHVPDVGRALGELARVLRPGGRLVAVTNSNDHLRELRELVGRPRPSWTFSAEDAEEQLRRSFARVERREAYGWIRFPGPAEVREYLDATSWLWQEAQAPRLELDGPLSVRRAPVVFVAHA